MSTHIEEAMERAWSPNSIDRLHLINGGWPIPNFRIPMDKLIAITKGSPRIAMSGVPKGISTNIYLKKILAGGIRMPHLHMQDEIVLFDKSVLQEYLHAAAEEVKNIEDITEIRDFIRQ